eukprot:CAMPEP_0201883032 /NCGR_PEP_ID=MMETSP0902-20130614/15108_1 /ASSEMBLY_ACC=CAM_ASM_000551 /TAXON_ID=420261 /ORGANISM="Thalassiosira antarctica, Strain CCMP982" /LENGTH=271 /DNA_ID=CAMNT_0048411735 /DNA_START=128 /DNA_END=943 /DNA_ORIENTATION=+
MSSTTRTSGSNGPALHAGQPGNAESVDPVGDNDNDSELLSANHSNHLPISPYLEITDTAPWAPTGGRCRAPAQSTGGEVKRLRGEEIGPTPFVVEHLGPNLHYPEEETSDSTSWRIMEIIGTQAWANLLPGLIAGLKKEVTELTLDFAAMMLVSDVTLQESHTEESLEALSETIMSVCIHVSTFRIIIDTARNEEWVEDQEDLALPTTDMQWGVIEQILGMVTRLVEASETLSTFDIAVNLKDSRLFVPCVILSPYVNGSNDLVIDPNMLN